MGGGLAVDKSLVFLVVPFGDRTPRDFGLRPGDLELDFPGFLEMSDFVLRSFRFGVSPPDNISLSNFSAFVVRLLMNWFKR